MKFNKIEELDKSEESESEELKTKLSDEELIVYLGQVATEAAREHLPAHMEKYQGYGLVCSYQHQKLILNDYKRVKKLCSDNDLTLLRWSSLSNDYDDNDDLGIKLNTLGIQGIQKPKKS